MKTTLTLTRSTTKHTGHGFIVDVHSSLPAPTLGLECNYMLAWLVANISKLELASLFFSKLDLAFLLFLFYFINNKSIHKAHEGTEAYIDYKQWTIELGGTISQGP